MPTKKTPAKRLSSRTKVTTSSVSQPAADRRAAEAELERLITKFAADRKRLVTAMRRGVRKHVPTANELLYEYRDCFVISFSPSFHGHEGVFSIRASAQDLRLYFNRGKTLTDPEKLLQGSGTQVRFVIVESPSTLTRPAVLHLIQQALAVNLNPFPAAGRGSVIVRSVLSTKRPRARTA